MKKVEARSPACLLLAASLSVLGCRAEAPGSEAVRAESSDPAAPKANPGQVTIGDIAWFVDYDAALAFARAQDKALWVHFGENPG